MPPGRLTNFTSTSSRIWFQPSSSKAFSNSFSCERGRSHQVLSPALAQSFQIGFADDPAIKISTPTGPGRTCVLPSASTLPASSHRCGPQPRSRSSGETLPIDDQRNHHLLTVGPMIATVTPPHHRILRRFSFHIAAGQVDLGLVRHQPIQTPIPAGILGRSSNAVAGYQRSSMANCRSDRKDQRWNLLRTPVQDHRRNKCFHPVPIPGAQRDGTSYPGM